MTSFDPATKAASIVRHAASHAATIASQAHHGTEQLVGGAKAVVGAAAHASQMVTQVVAGHVGSVLHNATRGAGGAVRTMVHIIPVPGKKPKVYIDANVMTGLRKLSGILAATSPVDAARALSDEDRALLRDMFDAARGNVSLNAALALYFPKRGERTVLLQVAAAGHAAVGKALGKKAAEPLLPPPGVSRAALEALWSFSHKTRHVEGLPALVETFRGALLQYSEHQPVTHTLTVVQLGALNTLAKAGVDKVVGDGETACDWLSMLREGGIFAEGADITATVDNLCEARALLAYFNSELQAELHGMLKPGDIIAVVCETSRWFKGEKPTLEDVIKLALIGIHDHTATAVVDKDGKWACSHITARYRQEPLDLPFMSFSRAFRFRPSRLVDDAAAAALLQHWGDAWADKLDARYNEIAAELHANGPQSAFRQVRNQGWRQVQAGAGRHRRRTARTAESYRKLADKMWHASQPNGAWRPREPGSLAGGRKRSPKAPHMICSEFTAKTIIASLVKLERELPVGMPLPFKPYDKLRRVNPGLLVKRIEACSEKLEPPRVLQELLDSRKERIAESLAQL